MNISNCVFDNNLFLLYPQFVDPEHLAPIVNP